jgi:hypothetical protein
MKAIIMAKQWIQNMHMKRGALTKSASAAGKSPMRFAQEHKSDKGKTGARSRLALTLSKFHKH